MTNSQATLNYKNAHHLLTLPTPRLYLFFTHTRIRSSGSEMEKIKCCSEAIPIAIIAIAMSMSYMASAQITTACTSSLISSFTPCLNFITGSTNGGGSPTSGCCDALDSLMTSSTDCTCLILTGNVPFNLPINRALAITLPQLCNSQSVPLQCKGPYFRTI